jgi:hypothetical protein
LVDIAVAAVVVVTLVAIVAVGNIADSVVVVAVAGCIRFDPQGTPQVEGRLKKGDNKMIKN